MRRTAWFIVVLWAAEMGVEKCRGWADEAVKDVKNNISRVNQITKVGDKAEAAKTGASEVFSDAKDAAEAWADWAHDKVSKGLRYSEEEWKGTAHSMADKAGSAAIKTTQKINSAASDASNYASEKAEEAVKAASDMKSKAKETLVSGKEKAEELYEEAKECSNCEDARELVSKAADEIRATIRENTAEL